MAKANKITRPTTSTKQSNQPNTNADSIVDSQKFHLPIEPKPGQSAGSPTRPRRVMILLALLLALIGALAVWWLGRDLSS